MTEKLAKGISAYIKMCEKKSFLPSIEGLAVHLVVARATLYDWAEMRLFRQRGQLGLAFRLPRAALSVTKPRRAVAHEA